VKQLLDQTELKTLSRCGPHKSNNFIFTCIIKL